jgi:hypothetical protein
MGDQPPERKAKTKRASSPRLTEARIESSGEVVVQHHTTPPAAPAELKIHARRLLPPVPDAASEPSKVETKEED